MTQRAHRQALKAKRKRDKAVEYAIMLLETQHSVSHVSLSAQIKEGFKVSFEEAEQVVNEAIELLNHV